MDSLQDSDNVPYWSSTSLSRPSKHTGGPLLPRCHALLQWFQKQNFGCKLDIPASMNGAAFMKLNLIRLNQCCKLKKSNKLISRQKAQIIFDALRTAARNARKEGKNEDVKKKSGKG